ncbi:hypothetical protein Dda_7229 [Drechslerella dactyloides]|uniref:Uncharacterized protein n=1 Tax=Drechslerella dactyloides TaxID=74499 RepID=A0AAD6ITN1_DREDA|nr:hypothetical protein Dda_7229 [Drechslerella dactyloides]
MAAPSIAENSRDNPFFAGHTPETSRPRPLHVRMGEFPPPPKQPISYPTRLRKIPPDLPPPPQRQTRTETAVSAADEPARPQHHQIIHLGQLINPEIFQILLLVPVQHAPFIYHQDPELQGFRS